MTRRFLILLVLLTIFELKCFPQILNKDERLRNIVSLYGQAEVTVPLTGSKAMNNLTINVSILSVKNKEVHVSLSPLTVDWFILQSFDYSLSERSDIKGVISAGSAKQAMEWDKYPTYSQYDSIMQSFQLLYPSLCHLDTIGTSVNGRLVFALRISDNAAIDEDEPEVFYTSTIHGDETGGFVLMLRLADYLLKNYNLSTRVKNLVDGLEIWINPLANPDGTYRTGNIISSPTRFNANGVDLNRNFPDPLQPSQNQQKENSDMIKFLMKHKFVLSANFHAGVEVVNYPWDRWPGLHADDEWFYSISRGYADTVHKYSVPGYMIDLDNGITNGYQWYQILGGRQDFITYELHGREVTIELDGDYHVTPASKLNSLWQYNWRSFLGYLEFALHGIHGEVRNISTLAPVPAKVFITGHDKHNSYVCSDTLTGSFVRLLAPGLWNLTFSAFGYLDSTINDVLVKAGEETHLIVDMIPVISNIDITDPEIPLLYPVPVKSELKALLPEKIAGIVNIRVIGQTGIIFSDYETEVLFGVPLRIDVMNLQAGTYTVIFTNGEAKTSLSGRFIVIR